MNLQYIDLIEGWEPEKDLASTGYVNSVGDGIVLASGLEDVLSNELVILQGSMYGLAINLQKENVGIFLFGNDRLIGIGNTVEKTNKIASIPVGTDAYLGRLVDSLGNFIDGLGSVEFPARALIDTKAPGIVERESVRQSLFTGIKAVDNMTPIGKGQRKLIIGDRQTGKTGIISSFKTKTDCLNRFFHNNTKLNFACKKDEFSFICSDSQFNMFVEEEHFEFNFIRPLVGYNQDFILINSDSCLDDFDEGQEVDKSKAFVLLYSPETQHYSSVIGSSIPVDVESFYDRSREKNIFEKYFYRVKKRLVFFLFHDRSLFVNLFIYILNFFLIFLLNTLVKFQIKLDNSILEIFTNLYVFVFFLFCCGPFYTYIIKKYKYSIIFFIFRFFGNNGIIFFYLVSSLILTFNWTIFFFLIKMVISVIFFNTQDGQIMVENFAFILIRNYGGLEKLIDFFFIFFRLFEFYSKSMHLEFFDLNFTDLLRQVLRCSRSYEQTEIILVDYFNSISKTEISFKNRNGEKFVVFRDFPKNFWEFIFTVFNSVTVLFASNIFFWLITGSFPQVNTCSKNSWESIAKVLDYIVPRMNPSWYDGSYLLSFAVAAGKLFLWTKVLGFWWPEIYGINHDNSNVALTRLSPIYNIVSFYELESFVNWSFDYLSRFGIIDLSYTFDMLKAAEEVDFSKFSANYNYTAVVYEIKIRKLVILFNIVNDAWGELFGRYLFCFAQLLISFS